MIYEKAATADELKDGEKKKVVLKDKVLLLTRLNGTFYALDNKCPHMGGSLADGNLEGATLSCPRHGAKFDVRTGKNVGGAKLAFIKAKVGDAKMFPVKVEGKDILVELE